MEHQQGERELLSIVELLKSLEAAGVGRYSLKSVYRWLQCEPPVPVAKPGGPGRPHLFDPEAVIAWLDITQANEVAGTEIEEGFTDPRLEKANQQARLAGLQADVHEGVIMRREQAKEELAGMIRAGRQVLEATPEKIAAAAIHDDRPEAVKRIAREEVNRALERMRNHWSSAGQGRGSP